jgi:hypothetical protein
MHHRAVLIAISMLAATLLCGRQVSAQSPSPPPEIVAAARDLVTASRAADHLKMLLPAIMQQLKPAIVQGCPDVGRDFDAIMPQLIDATEARSEAFAEGVVVIYARNFTADELREVTAFYRGPVGQKFLEKMPVIAQESVAMGQKFGQEIGAELRNRMIEELRKRGHNI